MGEANVVACDVIDVDGHEATIRVERLTHRVSGRGMRPGPAKLAVRPNAITLEPSAAGSFSGEITHTAYLGDHVEYEVKTAAGTLFVVDPAVERALAPQTNVAIAFKERGIALING